ncbi:O-antigen ligase [Mycolicibacterium sp. P1-5]|uniref:O-antigen ligase family protein n=1 Tax=Mycolicibacterium sp. P1-5 TaxID=2024617 RepID=UPI0011F085A8|nr:O-antigen ligase family protein [Mycolicibacterium sp. P1-5]KAA0110740.1 O-antigen ligase domain-containing protein [Mycolicibacterium sp. P1-5]
MTGLIRFAPSPGEYVAMALAGGAATFGAILMFGSRNPLFLLAATIGAVGLVFAARRPAFALAIIVFIEVSNLSGVLDQYGTVPVFQASMLLGVVTIALALRDPELRGRLNAWTAICAGLAGIFLATQLVSVIGSVDITASLASARRTAIDLIFLLIVLILTQMTARPWLVAAVVVGVLAALSVLTVIDQVVYAGTTSFGGFSIVTTSSGEDVTTLRYGGPLPDSNFWGRHLIMGLPMAAALLTRSLRLSQRPVAFAWGFSIVALLAGSYLTQSRGTFLSAAIAMVVWFLATERPVRRWGLVSLPLAFGLLLVPGVGNRLQKMFSEISQGPEGGHIDPSLLGRLAAQEQAGLMWHERPLFGFGPGTFPGEVFNFAGRVATAQLEAPDGAHNTYLSLAAESGLLGIIGWVVMVAGFLAVLVMRNTAQPRSPDRVLVAALIAAIIGWSVSSAWLHLAYFRTFAVVLAMVAAVAPALPMPAEALRKFWRAAAVWLMAGVVGFGVFWLYLSATGPSKVQAVQRATLVPAVPTDGWYAYALDIRSRMEMLPTFAVVLHDENSPVSIDADSVRGLLVFTAEAGTASQARDELQLAVAQAGNRLSDSVGFNQYVLQGIASMQLTEVRDRSTVVGGIGLGVAAGLVTGLALASVTARRRRPEDHVAVRELAALRSG